MSTVQSKLGPADHGRAMTLDEFDDADYEPGYKYELIDGRLYVSPDPESTPKTFSRIGCIGNCSTTRIGTRMSSTT